MAQTGEEVTEDDSSFFQGDMYARDEMDDKADKTDMPEKNDKADNHEQNDKKVKSDSKTASSGSLKPPINSIEAWLVSFCNCFFVGSNCWGLDFMCLDLKL